MNSRKYEKDSNIADMYESTHNLDYDKKKKNVPGITTVEEKNSLKFDEETVFLIMEEVYKIELLQERKSKINAEIATVAQTIETKRMAIQNLELSVLNVKNDMKVMSGQIEEKKNVLRKTQNEYNDYIKSINDKYKLTRQWGYDPESGQVTLDEKK